MPTSSDAKLVAAVAVCLTLGFASPAIADGVRHAMFAHNADKVDGKHAVSAGAAVSTRKGKLVATDGMTGRLPDNIIRRAPNSDRLDGIDSSGFLAADARAADTTRVNGYTHGELRTLSIPLHGAYLWWATDDPAGITMWPNQGFEVSFMIPPDHAAATAVRAEAVLTQEDESCDMAFTVTGRFADPTSGNSGNVSWTLPGGTGTALVASRGGETADVQRLVVTATGHQFQPGASLTLQLMRTGEGDTCALNATVNGMQVRY